MRKIRTLAYFLVVFFAGSLTSSAYEWLQPISTVEITNASDQPVKYIDISFRGLGEHQARTAESLQPRETATFKWITHGESNYRLRVYFEDDTEVTGQSIYIERGETSRVSIGLGKIETRSRMLPLLPFYSEPRDTTHTDKPSSRFQRGNAG